MERSRVVGTEQGGDEADDTPIVGRLEELSLIIIGKTKPTFPKSGVCARRLEVEGLPRCAAMNAAEPICVESLIGWKVPGIGSGDQRVFAREIELLGIGR